MALVVSDKDLEKVINGNGDNTTVGSIARELKRARAAIAELRVLGFDLSHKDVKNV